MKSHQIKQTKGKELDAQIVFGNLSHILPIHIYIRRIQHARSPAINKLSLSKFFG